MMDVVEENIVVVAGSETTELIKTKQHPFEVSYDAALLLVNNCPDEAMVAFKSLLFSKRSVTSAAVSETGNEELEVIHRVKEHAIYELASLYTKHGHEDELTNLLSSIRPFFLTIPKAKTGKIVRTVIDMVSKIKVSDKMNGTSILSLQAELCLESIKWCNEEKHTFLRQRIESRLAMILFEQRKFKQALDLILRLSLEIKKMDDKQLLVEIHLTEAKLNHALQNTPKAKSALTAARSIANSIYVIPKIQAAIDMMSGTLHAEERDYKTSYSYFFEAFEALNQMHEKQDALSAMKYMLLSKVASGQASDVQNIINSKSGIKYAGLDLEALSAVAKAHEKRSLEDFQNVIDQYKAQLGDDALIQRHLVLLYDKLLDSNLLKIIQPFSVVEVTHVAKLIKLPAAQIETKLSKMILDGKFNGTLDQGKGHLVVYDSVREDKSYAYGLELVDQVDQVIGSLFKRADHLLIA